MTESKVLSVRVDPDLHDAIQAFHSEAGLASPGEALRLLIEAGLRARTNGGAVDWEGLGVIQANARTAAIVHIYATLARVLREEGYVQ